MSYTPSTFVALSTASAPISAARSAAQVSVVTNGLPVPAAKMIARPFSRCLIAFRRMNGSHTVLIGNALITRVGWPKLSIVSCNASAFRTVANMPM